MQIRDLVTKLDQLLLVDQWLNTDHSQNGLQVQPAAQEIKKVALAVDANLDTFVQAAREKVELLFVHHGLFWRENLLVTGVHYQRLCALLRSGVGLYASHLPLDAHPKLGHNAQLAKLFKLQNLQPLDVGWHGDLPKPLSRAEVLAQLKLPPQHHAHFLEFGPAQVSHLGIISGGGGAHTYVNLAYAAGCDLYLTGEISHLTVQFAREAKLNVIAAGHYWTEMIGLLALERYLQTEFNLETVWLESPTGF